MKATFKLGLIFIAALSVSACDSLDFSSNKGKFQYSNPTTKNITFKFDGKSYDVLPGAKGIIKISSGMHKLEIVKVIFSHSWFWMIIKAGLSILIIMSIIRYQKSMLLKGNQINLNQQPMM